MGMLDDNGPEMNFLTNMALFKFPSVRPPSEIVEVQAVGAVIATGVIAVGALIYGACHVAQDLSKAVLPPAPVVAPVGSENSIKYGVSDAIPVVNSPQGSGAAPR